MTGNIYRAKKVLGLRMIIAVSLLGVGIINEQTLDCTRVQFGTLRLMNMNIWGATKCSKRQAMIKANMRIRYC